MSSIKKATAFILTQIILINLLLCSCGKTETDSSATGESSDTLPASIEDQTEDGLRDSLPDNLDFGGKTFVIAARGDKESFLEVDSEQTGDVLDDAIYNRNTAVEKRLNIKIEGYRGETWANYQEEIKKIQTSIQAGDDDYQLVAGWRAHIPNLALQNCFFDLNNMPYIDKSMPWWNQSAANGMNLGGKTYFLTGDISIITLLGGCFAMYLNDRMAADFNVGDLSQSVLDQTWTLDKMISVIKSVHVDLNGDGVMNENDQYGLVLDLYNSADTFYTASNIHQISLDSDGYPIFTEEIEKVSALLDKVNPLYYGDGSNGSFMSIDTTIQKNMFRNGQAMIIPREVDIARIEFRDVEDSYTLLPFPKFNEEQDSYYTGAYNGATLWGIPVSNPDADSSCAVMEALASESYNEVTKVYYETCLQLKYARNENTIKMLDIIRENMCLDAEYLYSPLLGFPCEIFRSIIGERSTDVASWYAKNSAKINAEIKLTMDSMLSAE